MVFETIYQPGDTAAIFHALHRAENFTDRNRLIGESPPTKGCSISPKMKNSDTHDQGRICLPQSLAAEIDKVWGVVIALKPEGYSENTLSPARAQILLKIPFWDKASSSYRSFYARTSAYFANFAPKCPDNLSWAITRGDIVSGILQKLEIPLKSIHSPVNKRTIQRKYSTLTWSAY